MPMLDSKYRCPKCYSASVEITTNNGEVSHYMCRNPNCINDADRRTQFKIIYDTETKFPYNVIFRDRDKSEFYKKPYLVITPHGLESTGYREPSSEETSPGTSDP